MLDEFEPYPSNFNGRPFSEIVTVEIVGCKQVEAGYWQIDVVFTAQPIKDDE